MGEAYFNLKHKLEELGYNNTLPLDGVPLVECIISDLLQTTRSLQHYMELSKEALMQRDSLMMEAEPYKCENSKLIQENNQLHRSIMQLKDENLKLSKDSSRRIKSLSEELIKKDLLITKLKHDLRDLSLRGLCAGTSSSRNKSKKKDLIDNQTNVCFCKDEHEIATKDITDLKSNFQLLQDKNNSLADEITCLKSQIEHRDSEIVRLNIMLEGGRPFTAISKDCCNINSDNRIPNLMTQLRELEIANDLLRKEIDEGLDKQHEAMTRALNLAGKNKILQDELQKVDALALKVEDDCNKKISALTTDIHFLQSKIKGLTLKNAELEKELLIKTKETKSPENDNSLSFLTNVIKEKETLQKEIQDLVDVNKTLLTKLSSSSHNNGCYSWNNVDKRNPNTNQCLTKDELQLLLQNEREKYVHHVESIQEKLNEALKHIKCNQTKCNVRSSSPSIKSPRHNEFIKNLHNKLCESEQKILMLKKENDELQCTVANQDKKYRQNYKDVISQLNTENSELSKENIALSQQLSQHRNLSSTKFNDRGDCYRQDIQKLQDELKKMRDETHLLKKDKQEYNLRYREAMDSVDKLKRDLILKQKEVEKLEEENCSYKMSTRTGKASTEHFKDECNLLREQIKMMQSDFIKEKTLANQIKNIQLETERSSNEIQNELLHLQKKLSLAKDTIESQEKKYKDLQSEMLSLKNDKLNLIENIKKVDQERDKLVIELDHKTENNSVLQQKINSQSFEISRLESEIDELKRKLNINKISEHKLVDSDAQMKFLNGEISKLTQQLDNAAMENKRLQNSLADANGTLRITKVEYEKSRKEVEGLRQQLQHYVAEIRRIEELLSQKEADRSDMLEQFASLSVEANILENTNHSLESESASKSVQLQSYISKIEHLESSILDKEAIIDNQSTRIAAMTCKISSLENEVKLITEEKEILEQNVSYLKQMCQNLQSDQTNKSIGNTDSELKLYENKIRNLSNAKAILEVERNQIKSNLNTTESLLTNARKEIIELKLALQDATTETKALNEHINKLRRIETEVHETTLTKELELPLMLEETIHEVSHEEDEDSSRYHEIHKRYSKYSHGGTI